MYNLVYVCTILISTCINSSNSNLYKTLSQDWFGMGGMIFAISSFIWDYFIVKKELFKKNLISYNFIWLNFELNIKQTLKN